MNTPRDGGGRDLDELADAMAEVAGEEWPHPDGYPNPELLAKWVVESAVDDGGIRKEDLDETREEVVKMANVCRNAFVEYDYVAEHQGILPEPVRGDVYDTGIELAELNSWLRAYADQLDAIVRFIEQQEDGDAE